MDFINGHTFCNKVLSECDMHTSFTHSLTHLLKNILEKKLNN